MTDHETIDLYIQLVRKTLSACAEILENFNEGIVQFLNIKQNSDYGFIIDSFYLLEDTQSAKENFRSFGVSGATKYENVGEIYLRVYGLLNACYLQQQAVIMIHEKLELSLNVKELKAFPIFNLRNTFAAHTVNRGEGKNKRSYILDRDALRRGRLNGYSTNSQSGDDFIEEDISTHLDSWDSLLKSKLEIISETILQNRNDNTLLSGELPMLKLVLSRIRECSNGTCLYSDIWSETATKIVFGPSGGGKA